MSVRYNRSHQYVDFKEGDLVLVYNPHPKLRTTNKLNHRFYGPLEVIAKISSVNYRVRACYGKQAEDTVHVWSMKNFYVRPVAEETKETESK